MAVAPEILSLLVQINQQPAMHQTPIEMLRQRRPRIGLDNIHPIKNTQDITIASDGHDMRARIYHPLETSIQPSLLVFFHGGGFVFGGLEGYYDHVCRMLCDHSNSIVVSVDYRLAPENKFPAATNDAWNALVWSHNNISQLGANKDQLFVAGGSTGANLAAVTAMRVRDQADFQIQGQVLFYPITNFPNPPTQSFETYNTGFYLTGADILWFWDQYLKSPADRLNPYAAPLQGKDLSQLAPAFVLTAEADPLRDEAESYARKMEQAGVEVTLTRYSGMIHGFMAFPTPRSDEALLEASAWIQMQKRKL